MKYIFFYASAIIIWITFLVLIYFVHIDLKHYITGLASVAYSLCFESLLGDYKGLYYYINPDVSILYIVLAGVLIYPLLNIIYTFFLPKKMSRIILYTCVWIIAMLLFEQLSLRARVIVLTGWKVFPWSAFTYALTYLWVINFYRYLNSRIPQKAHI